LFLLKIPFEKVFAVLEFWGGAHMVRMTPLDW
jgi:hypothetical protein